VLLLWIVECSITNQSLRGNLHIQTLHLINYLLILTGTCRKLLIDYCVSLGKVIDIIFAVMYECYYSVSQ